jgi:RNA polymerase sigma-70 factor (ECF subfamily)
MAKGHARLTPETFQALYTTHAVVVLKQARALVGLSDADDVAQQVWLRVWQRFDTFRGDAKISTWLYTVTRRCAFDRARLHRSRPAGYREPLDAATDLLDPSPTPEERSIALDDRRQLRRIVLDLPPHERDALRGLLRGELGRETAARLGIGHGALKSRLGRARNRMAANLNTCHVEQGMDARGSRQLSRRPGGVTAVHPDLQTSTGDRRRGVLVPHMPPGGGSARSPLRNTHEAIDRLS